MLANLARNPNDITAAGYVPRMSDFFIDPSVGKLVKLERQRRLAKALTEMIVDCLHELGDDWDFGNCKAIQADEKEVHLYLSFYHH